MPSKVRDQERERDPDTPRSKEKSRHKSRRSSRKVDKASTEHTSINASPAPKPRRASMPLPELEIHQTDVPLTSKTSLAYPSFSKAHSKESVGSRENVVNPRTSYYTPDPTDIDRGKGSADGAKLNDTSNLPPHRAPPSPPETTMDQKVSMARAKGDTVKKERKGTDLQKHADDLKRKLGRAGSSASDREKDRPIPSRSRTSVGEFGKEDKPTRSAKSSKTNTPSKLKPKIVTESASTMSLRRSASSTHSVVKSDASKGSTNDSDTTSVAPNQTKVQRSPLADCDSSPATDPDSSPRTPTIAEPQFPSTRNETPVLSTPNDYGLASALGESPMPPPPPPPLQLPMPRVDYLMQNGGLPQSVPRSLLGAGLPTHTLPVPTIAAQAEKFFGPLSKVLEDYTKVITRSGSLAVATGYRSVARRLLDRLEAVFARDISSETCTCVLCQMSPPSEIELEDKRGVSWGEILEYVCGRQELPQWPAFVMDSTQTGLGISTPDHVPMQKLDVDVPEEFRDHYIRQSKKTKISVDQWLDNQPQQPSSPPQDVDDETLTFAMLTRLDPEQRSIFLSLTGVQPSRPPSAPSEAAAASINPRSELLQKTGLAIQRLYRLAKPPRDPESAMYLLNNPALHNVLATLAAISDPEWDILTSGRFDGFLRSGADDHPVIPTPAPPSRAASRSSYPARMTPSIPPSRGPTPFTRGQTPATAGAPVALDEETEIAVLAEVEREIFLSMDHLEHAFEALHYKAESVRQALRERGAGLAQANQRRGIFDLDSRMGTPASYMGEGHRAWESETDDGIDDGMSEIAPDDSASNVSSSRHRRHKRRTERRTPAPVEEEDEEQSKVGSKAGRWR
ncbi:MAG: hypothetical protein ASARMPREDX12_005431 [Alectoria sarmentosa]|nr:MAG: hypothetical protein ASARMPREDX12_005431 [Alectoria sarmentosa]